MFGKGPNNKICLEQTSPAVLCLFQSIGAVSWEVGLSVRSAVMLVYPNCMCSCSNSVYLYSQWWRVWVIMSYLLCHGITDTLIENVLKKSCTFIIRNASIIENIVSCSIWRRKQLVEVYALHCYCPLMEMNNNEKYLI